MDIQIPADNQILPGTLTIPPKACCLVVFAHGSGSSRFSPRNQFVARVLEKAGLATLLFDLLTSEEEALDEASGELRFDIPFLTQRLLAAARWVEKESGLPLGFFGASTGAAAALAAAAAIGPRIKAVVSRGGRPDLAAGALPKVKSPTLLIIGGLDFGVIELNREAFARLNCPKQLEIVPGATHLFEEKGTLDTVANLSADWFRSHCRTG